MKVNDVIVRANEAIARVDETNSKLRKTLNTGLVLIGIFAVPFLFAFVDTRVSISDLEKNSVTKEQFQESTDKFYQTFVQAQDALLVHQLEHDWVRTQFYKITKDDAYSVGGDDQVKNIIKAFFTDPHRGIGAETRRNNFV